MRSCQIMDMRVLMMLVLIAVVSNTVWARSTVPAFDFPLTPHEQAARLRALPSQKITRGLYPSGVMAVNTIRPMPFFQRNYRSEWLAASPDQRVKLAEKIGEQGRAKFAAEQQVGTQLLGSRGRGLKQGPDSVYWDRSGRVTVLEAKGGTSQIKWTFNSKQGTNQNTIRSAEYVLKSSKAKDKEKRAAAHILVAAQKNQLDTYVVKTEHVLGKPNTPKLVSRDYFTLVAGDYVTNVAREAGKIRREIIKKDPEARRYFREASRDHWQGRLKYRVPQGLAFVGFASALGLGWDAYQRSRVAWSMFDDPTLKGSILPYMQTGMAFGRMAQATTLVGMGSAGATGYFEDVRKKGIGRIAGRAFLPITVGVEGLQLITAYHEYGLGRINQREFYRRSAGPAIMAVFTTGGATLGGFIGSYAGGVGAIPGAMTGATIGAFAAIPLQFAADYMVSWYYREFDAQQLRAVNAEVEAFYGLETHRSGGP